MDMTWLTPNSNHGYQQNVIKFELLSPTTSIYFLLRKQRRTASSTCSRRFGVHKAFFPPKVIQVQLPTSITFGRKRCLQTQNLLELAVLHQSLWVATANNGVFRKGKLQQRFFSKYTWKMAFVLSRIRSGTL